MNSYPSMNINDHLTVEEFPAMELDQFPFDRAADWAAMQLATNTSAIIEMEPDDGTRYIILVAKMPPGKPGYEGPPYSVGNSFGPLYPWNGEPSIHPRYAQEHYVHGNSGWTATVIARFLNTLAERLES